MQDQLEPFVGTKQNINQPPLKPYTEPHLNLSLRITHDSTVSSRLNHDNDIIHRLNAIQDLHKS